MLRTALLWTAVAVVSTNYLESATLRTSVPQSASPYHAVLNQYCVTCHNEDLNTAGLALDQVNVDSAAENAPVWENVVRKLRAGTMPPPGSPRPDAATYDSLATYLEATLDQAAQSRPNPGTSTIHRMNRAEYSNAIRDLLAIDPEAVEIASLLSPDDSGYGFDNISEVLSVSPVLLERYMSVARRVSRLAVGDPTIRPDFSTYEVPRFLLQNARISEALPFGSRGGIAIRHHFPLDGDYVIRIHLKTNYNGQNILGLSEENTLDLRLDGERITQFTIGGSGSELELPTGPNRSFSSEQQRGDSPMDLEFRVQVRAGARRVGVHFLRRKQATENVLAPRFASQEVESNEEPGIGRVTIDGPYDVTGPGDTQSRRKIFVCHPANSNEEEACAGEILSALARHAYRRPITADDLERLLGPYRLGRNESGFEAGIQTAIQRILVSPEFLFRIERDPAELAQGTAYRVSDLELASRLSFFFWSSIPDDELLSLAERGSLSDPEVLERQVLRMLADRRSRALVDNFAGQWLYLRNVQSALPDLAQYPYFDENLREALEKETGLFLQSMLREDRSVLDMLSADYTFLNERLARHYGIPDVYGSHFRRVTLNDENRHGLLGQGSIQMVTSYGNRTSPTLRGKWVLDNLLGAPPPPPPADGPALQDRGEGGQILSMREQMEEHRANAACAVCHRMMDPLGFALENFDAIGQWRNVSGPDSTPIDSSGVLPDGTTFDGPVELRQVLASRSKQFVATVTEKLLTYALGRGLDYNDAPTVRKIIREAEPRNYPWSDLMLGIVRSDPFQMRRTQGP